MKKLVFLTIVFFYSTSCYAQIPQPAMLSLRCIGGNYSDGISNKVIGTDDGGFILSLNSVSTSNNGTFDSFCTIGGKRSIFLKYNGDATILEMSKCYKIDGDTTLNYFFPKSDGSIVLAGQKTGGGLYITKHDVYDNIMWAHTHSAANGTWLTDIIATEDGGYLIAGASYYIDTNAITHHGSWMDADVLLMKLDYMGNKVWSKVIGGTGIDEIHSIIPAPNNGYYISGFTSSNDYDCSGNHGGNGDSYLARLDNMGNVIWHRDLGGSLAENIGYMTSDGKNGVLLATYTYSIDGDVSDHTGTGQRIWTTNIDSAGNIVWNICHGGIASYPKCILKLLRPKKRLST